MKVILISLNHFQKVKDINIKSKLIKDFAGKRQNLNRSINERINITQISH